MGSRLFYIFLIVYSLSKANCDSCQCLLNLGFVKVSQIRHNGAWALSGVCVTHECGSLRPPPWVSTGQKAACEVGEWGHMRGHVPDSSQRANQSRKQQRHQAEPPSQSWFPPTAFSTSVKQGHNIRAAVLTSLKPS
jgi:hypothetical protein